MISADPKHKLPIISVQLDGKYVSALADSGANMTIIRKDLIDPTKISKNKREVKGVGGPSTLTTTASSVKISLKNYTCNMTNVALTDQEFPFGIILGSDFYVTMGLILATFGDSCRLYDKTTGELIYTNQTELPIPGNLKLSKYDFKRLYKKAKPAINDTPIPTPTLRNKQPHAYFATNTSIDNELPIVFVTCKLFFNSKYRSALR